MLMKFFRNPFTGEVSAFEWPKDKGWAAPHLVEMTDAEVEAHVNPPAPIPTRAEIGRRRLMEYADPVNGSDRHFSEASAEQDSGNIEKAEWCRALGRARREEIQKSNPWPEGE